MNRNVLQQKTRERVLVNGDLHVTRRFFLETQRSFDESLNRLICYRLLLLLLMLLLLHHTLPNLHYTPSSSNAIHTHILATNHQHTKHFSAVCTATCHAAADELAESQDTQPRYVIVVYTTGQAPLAAASFAKQINTTVRQLGETRA